MNTEVTVGKSHLQSPLNSISPIGFERAYEVKKGWGKEIHIVNNHNYCGKILLFHSGGTFSLHYHFDKHETFYVLDGEFTLNYRNLHKGSVSTKTISKGDVVIIPPGNPHQIICHSKVGKIIEFSTPDYSSDSYRIEPGDSQHKLL